MAEDATARAYALLGIALCAGGWLFARSRERAGRSFYAAEVYHLTARAHRRFAIGSLIAGALFVAALWLPIIDVPLLAVYVLALILYASSFARGFSGEDE